jgi:hypothetical protein
MRTSQSACPGDLLRGYIAWDERFPTKKAALGFARTHQWPSGYRAWRGELRATPNQ